MGVSGYLLLGKGCHNHPQADDTVSVPHEGCQQGSRSKEFRGASALGNASIGHNPQRRAWNKSAGCWSKTAVCTKLAPYTYRWGDTLHAPSVTSSMAAIAIACKSSMPLIALVKAERINLSNYLIHVFMHQFCWEARCANFCSGRWLKLAAQSMWSIGFGMLKPPPGRRLYQWILYPSPHMLGPTRQKHSADVAALGHTRGGLQ